MFAAVFGSLYIRALAPPGWILYLFAIPYGLVLSGHAFTHVIYACTGPHSVRQYVGIIVSHLLLVGGALWQWDFNDTNFIWAPATEIFQIGPVAVASYGWALLLNAFVLILICASWVWLWIDRRKILRARAAIQ